MLHTTFANLRSHLRRLLSTGLAVVLGVGFLAATLLIGSSVRGAFDQSFDEWTDGVAVAVRSDSRIGSDEVVAQIGTLDLALAEQVATVDGVGVIAPSVEGSARIIGADGEALGGDGPPTLAGNWVEDDGLNPYDLAEGRAPAAPDEVVIDRRSADLGELSVGDTTTVLTPRPVEVTIVGIGTYGDRDSFGPTTFTAFTTEQAQDLFVGDREQVHQLLVAATPDVDPDALAAEVTALVPDGTEVLTGDELAADLMAMIESDFIGFFETMLLAFAAIALLVATFSIHNTFSILVAQRVRESALLRAIGASRGQVLGAVTIEALLVGAVASGLGVAVGVGLGHLALWAMDGAGFGMGTGLVLSPGRVAVAFAVGVLVTLVASLAPSVQASRVAPLAAIRDTAVERTRASRPRTAVGLGLLGLSAVALVSAPSAGDGAIARAGLGAAGVLVAVVMLGPVVARPVASALGLPVALVRGQSGVLARRNAVRNPRRTAGTASALTLGVAVVALFTVFASSITAAIDDTVARQFGGDLVVASDDFSSAGLSGDLAPAIEELPEVARAVGGGNAVMEIDGDTEYATAIDVARLDGLLDMGVAEGSLADLGPDDLAVSSDMAEDHGWEVGDVVTAIPSPGATEQLRIVALYENTDLLGPVLVHPEMWARHTAQPADVAILVEAAPGVGLDEARAAIAAVTERFDAPAPQDRDEYVDAVAGEVEAILGIVYGLLVVAVLIALMGIANTVSLSVHERTRELGLLRAVGQTRRQLRSMVRWESVIVAVFGTAVGVLLGVVLGWGLLRAISEAEGIATPLAVPVGQLAVIVGIGAVAGILAAWRPARRASRLDVLAAIATD
ncbi:ABC transporter permease [Actinomarinicola tropica]|uniref:FtsX-like permease family protein n=1 Tax=Actinomarinicola tropica TaxID=2789776 RepID=A0A5Q2RJ88_9ACTN|nr:FtsX-like permease family protein [Actinomarinicola tropica]QGG96839.1 FtsX-like permease family protein [Actinomarinicola tropica]